MRVRARQLVLLLFSFSFCTASPLSQKDQKVSYYTSHHESGWGIPSRNPDSEPIVGSTTFHRTKHLFPRSQYGLPPPRGSPPTESFANPNIHQHLKAHPSLLSFSHHLNPTADSREPVAGGGNKQDPLFSTMLRSVGRLFGFQSKKEENRSHHIKTEEPADENSESDGFGSGEDHLKEQEKQGMSFSRKTGIHNDLGGARRVSDASTNPAEADSGTELSHKDLMQMVRLCRQMFEGIERALSIDNTPGLSQPASAQQEDERSQRPRSDGTGLATNEREEMARETLPDVRLALAQAAQLNRRRERERQTKLAELDDEQEDDLDYTEGLPRSAPSYPTRVRLQLAADAKRMGQDKNYDDIARAAGIPVRRM